MDNPETLATLGKKYPDRRQTKKKHTSQDWKLKG